MSFTLCQTWLRPSPTNFPGPPGSELLWINQSAREFDSIVCHSLTVLALRPTRAGISTFYRDQMRVRKVLKESFFPTKVLSTGMLLYFLEFWHYRMCRSAGLEVTQWRRTIWAGSAVHSLFQEVQFIVCFRKSRLGRKVRVESSVAESCTISSRRLRWDIVFI